MAPLVLEGPGCRHLQAMDEPAGPRAEACEECGARKVLRVCLECGHVGCCESRRGHAELHARETGHLLVRAWRGGAFTYCYEDGYL
jgi:uncharacterized UBP type Zn finger protein